MLKESISGAVGVGSGSSTNNLNSLEGKEHSPTANSSSGSTGAANANSHILTPNSANSTSNSGGHMGHSGGGHHSSTSRDTPPVSPPSSTTVASAALHFAGHTHAHHHNHHHHNHHRQANNNASAALAAAGAGMGAYCDTPNMTILNMNQPGSIWSPTAANFNLNANHHLIAAAVANLNGSVTPNASSTSPPVLLGYASNGGAGQSNGLGATTGNNPAGANTPPIYQGSAGISTSPYSISASSNSGNSNSSNSSSTSNNSNSNNLGQAGSGSNGGSAATAGSSNSSSAATTTANQLFNFQQQAAAMANPYENYYNATSYLAPYHTHAHLNSLNHANLANHTVAQNHYRHLQAADYMSADCLQSAANYNAAMQRPDAMWAAHKFHGF
jgi:hypothetical protein